MAFDFQHWMLGFCRAGGFLLMLPIFAATNVPVVLRVALAAFLGALIAPVIGEVAVSKSLAGSVMGLAVETLIGLALGFAAQVIMGACEVAGQLIASELGLNMSALVSPVSTAPTQAPGMMILLLATTLFFATDLHHWLIAGLIKSYSVLPPGGAHLHEGLLGHIVDLTGGMFVLAVQMAAPIMAVSFVILLVFSTLGRAVPQMNVFSESFVFRIMIGLFVFATTLPILAQHLGNALKRLPDDMMRVAQWLGA